MTNTNHSEPEHLDLIIAYLDGSITPAQRERLNELIDAGAIDALDISELEGLYQSMGRLSEPEPGTGMQDRFYRMLEEEQAKQEAIPEPIGWMNILRNKIEELGNLLSVRGLAYGLGVFLTGMVIGNWATPFEDYRQQLDRLSGEVSQMREVMMMTLLDNSSATERLKAVNISAELSSTDDRVAEALLRTLHNDPNVNVRLAAVDALVSHAGDPKVREGLVKAIGRQDSPLVQAALADAMLTLQEKRSVDEFRQLLDRDEEELDPALRDKLQQTITALS